MSEIINFYFLKKNETIVSIYTVEKEALDNMNMLIENDFVLANQTLTNVGIETVSDSLKGVAYDISNISNSYGIPLLVSCRVLYSCYKVELFSC